MIEADAMRKSLRDWGCDVDGAMERVLNDEAFYLDCLKQVLKDPGFSELNAAMERRDINAAFRAAHTLKGVTANMGLTPLLRVLVRIVEPLRAGHYDGVEEAMAELSVKLDQLGRLVQAAS